MTFDPMVQLAELRHEFGEHGGVNMSIEMSTTFTVLEADLMPDLFAGRRGPDKGGYYLYGRHFNPTVYVLGRQLGALEGTESGYCTASGMAAIVGALMQICAPGDHIVAGDTLYGGTFALLNEFLPAKCGITVTCVDGSDLAAIASAINPNTKVLYFETIANPTLDVLDVPAVADLAHKSGAKLVVDNTFAPLAVSPARHGADVVVHSLTKYISGASDTIAGVICTSKAFVEELVDLHTGALMLLGPTMDPQVAFRLSMRLPQLGVRIQEHNRRAQIFATRMEELGLNVGYPGLSSHRHHERLAKIVNEGYGFGGMLTLDVDEPERADRLMEYLQNEERFGYLAVSLGYFDTLMSRSMVSTSSELSDEAQIQAGISSGLIRLSIGYTGSLEQRWEQFERGLKKTGLI